MTSLSGITQNIKSLSGVVTISEGNGTTITNGDVQCNTLEVATGCTLNSTAFPRRGKSCGDWTDDVQHKLLVGNL